LLDTSTVVGIHFVWLLGLAVVLVTLAVVVLAVLLVAAGRRRPNQPPR